MVAACANPAALSGGSGELHAYLSRASWAIMSGNPPIETPWVSVPGMLTARCASNENATYLEVTLHADPSGRRADDISGDIFANGKVLPAWGLHLVDVNLALGNLVDLVGQQTKAWLASAAQGNSGKN
jgi:hypothetical protein